MGIELWVLRHGAPLLRILREQLARPSDEAGGRLVARSSEKADVAENLVAGERAHLPVAVGELGRQQFRDEVVGRVFGPPLDVLRIIGSAEVRRRRHGHDALLQPEALVDLVPQCLLVLLGDAQKHADCAHRDLRAQVGDEVEAFFPDERVKSPGRIRADLGFDRSQAPGREHAAQESTVQVVIRRVFKDEHARRQFEVRLDDLYDRAFGRAVGLPFDTAALDVGVAADGVELVFVVVEERRFVAQPLPHGVRVGVDLEVVRVVIRRGRDCGHLVSLHAASVRSDRHSCEVAD